MHHFEFRLNQIRYSIANKEVHKVTISLMDFVKDYLADTDLSDQTVELRKYYNLQRQLGSSEIPEKESITILSKANELLNQISQHQLTEIEQVLKNQYPATEYIKANQIVKRYSSSSNFQLGPVDTHLKPGQITGIVGENGNGKTTLLRILSRQLDYDGGTLSYQFDGKSLNDDYSIKQKIAYIPQRLDKWHGTLKENLHFSAATHGIYGVENEKFVEYIIHRMGLSNFAERRWSELSSGYKLRFELAKVLVWSPKVLILDEPLANLDINAQQWLLQDFKNFVTSIKNPVSILLSSQQLYEVENIADNIIFLRNGSCEYSGSMQDFMKNRDTNIFEISGNFTIHQLQQCFETSEYYFSENGTNINVNTPKDIDSSALLTAMIQSGFNIKYFRDISTSTKQLFKY